MEDKYLKDVFEAFDPALDSEDVFLEGLERKLLAVEYLKNLERQQRRAFWLRLLLALALGMVLGGVLVGVFLSMPKEWLGLDTPFSLPYLQLRGEQMRILLLLLSCLMMSPLVCSLSKLLAEGLTLEKLPKAYKHNF